MSIFTFVDKKETIDVLYNISYGGFGVSIKAIELYNHKQKNINPNFIEKKNFLYYNYERIDPIL